MLSLFDGWEEWEGHGRAVCARIPPLALFLTDAPEEEAAYRSAALAKPADVERIMRVVRFNHFMTGQDPRASVKTGQGDVEKQGMGLWGLGSLVNHAAERPTVTQEFYNGGRVMVLRAARDLAVGEELLVDYNESLEQRRAAAEAEKKEKKKGGGGSSKGGGGKGGGGDGGGGASKWPTREEYLRQKGVHACVGVPPRR